MIKGFFYSKEYNNMLKKFYKEFGVMSFNF